MTQRYGLPKQIFTDDPENLNGESRIQVDIAQTGFFTGHEFRSFYEFDIPTGASVYLRFVSPVEFILFQQSLQVDAGAVRFTAILGGTPSGSFATELPIIGKNRMLSRPQPYYENQITIQTGGTLSGGTVVDLMRAVSANATAQASSVGMNISDERGLPAGTYYLRLENINTGNATGMYSLYWEER